MGCNAWNHSPSCNCGFSGGHRRYTPANFSLSPHEICRSFSYWSLYGPKSSCSESLTYPITCPYCGADIFFHTNGNGDVVFFDDLGPPWPKHPCFNSISGRYHYKYSYTLYEISTVKSRSWDFLWNERNTPANNARRIARGILRSLDSGYSYGLVVDDERLRGHVIDDQGEIAIHDGDVRCVTLVGSGCRWSIEVLVSANDTQRCRGTVLLGPVEQGRLGSIHVLFMRNAIVDAEDAEPAKCPECGKTLIYWDQANKSHRHAICPQCAHIRLK